MLVAMATLCEAAELFAHPLTVGLSDQLHFENFDAVETAYALAVEKSGNVPLIIPATTNVMTLAKALKKIDILVLTGGADVDPARYGAERSVKCCEPDLKRDAFEFALVEAAMKLKKPILGICRGSQLLNVAFGGTLYQDLPSEKPSKVQHGFGDYYHPDVTNAAHTVEIAANSLFATVLGPEPLAVNSHHHQAVKDCGKGVKVVGRAPDGVVEIWEHESYPAMGIQFHPESPFGYLDESDDYDLRRLGKVYNQLLRSLVRRSEEWIVEKPVVLGKAAGEKDVVVFIGAHPDDMASEMGTALKMRGIFDVHVIDYTHGERGCGEVKFKSGWTKAKRTAEETKVCAALGATLHWLDEIDGEAFASRETTVRMALLLKTIKPRAVIMHWPIDVHQDHVMCYAASMRALEIAGLEPEIYFHLEESQSRNFQPFVYVNVEDVLEDKNRLIEFYKCQEGEKMAERKTTTERVHSRAVRGWKGGYLETYAVMSGTVKPGRSIFDKVPDSEF